MLLQVIGILFSGHVTAFSGMDKVQLTPQQTDSIKKFLQGFPVNIQLSIAIVRDGKAVYAGVVKEKDTFQIIENRDTIFEIGSLTKVFTSLLLSDFVNKGIVSTSDPVKNFFDFPLKQSNLGGKEMTLENLANHTSGLPRIDISMMLGNTNLNNPYMAYDEKKLNDYLQNRMKLDTVPGTKFAYSNLGGGLLGFILCRKVNKTYEQLLQENIFGPLGMKSSTTDLSLVKDRLINGRTPDGSVAENWTFRDAIAGAGAIKSCATDMVSFIEANFEADKVFELPRVKTFSINKKMDVGLGWMIKNEENKDTICWHNGGTGGYRSCLAMNVSKKKGVVILSNVSSFHILNGDIDKLCFALLNSLD